jgi:hypothetical protein
VQVIDILRAQNEMERVKGIEPSYSAWKGVGV